MARVPTIRGRRTLTQAPPQIDPRSIQSPFSQALESAVAIRDAIDSGLRDEGAEAGAKAVARDEDGNLVVEKPGILGHVLPQWAAARANAAETAYLVERKRDVQQAFSKLRQTYPTDAAKFNEEADAIVAHFRDGAPTEFSASVFRMARGEADRVSRGIQSTAERVELRKHESSIKAGLSDLENEMLALARQGGTDTPDFLERAAEYNDLLGILSAGSGKAALFGVSEEEVAVRKRNFMGRAALEASSRDVMGVYAAQGERAALEHARKIADSFGSLSDPQREEWVADQRVLINEREAARSKARGAAKRRALRRIQDAEATLLAGNDAASLLNDPSLLAPFEPDEAAAVMDELRAAKATGQAIKSLNGADPVTRAGIVNSIVVEGEGAAMKARMKAALQQEAASVQRRLDKDPVSQVAASSPELLDDMSEALKEGDPEAFRESVDALLEEQERLGAFNPRVLSKGHRRAIVANLVGEEDDPERTDNLKTEVSRLKEMAGPHFPRLMAELAEEDDFPAAAYGVGLVNGEHAKFLLAKAALEDPKVLRENVGKLGKGATGDLRDELANATRPLVESLAASGASQTYIAKVTDSIEALASQMAVEQGKVGGAAKRAFKEMFGDYHFEDGYRLPAEYDPDAIRIGLNALEDRFQPDDFTPPNLKPELTLKQNQRAYFSDIRAFGQWVTNADETGLILVDSQGTPVLETPPEEGGEPQVFEVSFEQIEGFARQRRERTTKRVRRIKGAFPD